MVGAFHDLLMVPRWNGSLGRDEHRNISDSTFLDAHGSSQDECSRHVFVLIALVKALMGVRLALRSSRYLSLILIQ
jgi:hypothetical protein